MIFACDEPTLTAMWGADRFRPSLYDLVFRSEEHAHCLCDPVVEGVQIGWNRRTVELLGFGQKAESSKSLPRRSGVMRRSSRSRAATCSSLRFRFVLPDLVSMVPRYYYTRRRRNFKLFGCLAGSPKVCSMESTKPLPWVARAAETLRSGFALVGLQPTE